MIQFKVGDRVMFARAFLNRTASYHQGFMRGTIEQIDTDSTIGGAHPVYVQWEGQEFEGQLNGHHPSTLIHYDRRHLEPN
jgi:hypothetical protein